ncbi:MAG: ATP-binding protein [Anaerolineae bacterium]|nr:ATP-binding protein [Phycisphaerae bacterium]
MRLREKYELITTPRVEPRRTTIQRYGIAIIAVALAGAARAVFWGVLANDVPFLLQLVAVAVAATIGGLGPGLLATILGAAVGFFLASYGDPARNSLSELSRFLIEASLISALGGWLAVARQRAEASDIARAALEKQMLEVGDKERRRFGHDLHDGLGQQLTGIALLSESLSNQLTAKSSPHALQAEQIASLVTETIGWTRELARGLSPLTLETDGLSAALEELAARASRLFTISCRFDCEQDTLPVADDAAIHVYRIVQEAISNSVRHGKAKHVEICAELESSVLTMTVTDDGSGLSAKTVAQPGIGLRIMQYRANLIGAKLHVARVSERGGTIVSCTLGASASNGRRTEPEARDDRH